MRINVDDFPVTFIFEQETFRILGDHLIVGRVISGDHLIFPIVKA